MKRKFSLLIATIATLTLSNVALAEDNNNQSLVIDEAEALAMDAQMYAQSYGVSYDEALERLTIMLYGEDAIEYVANSEVASLAGKYYDNGADFGLVIKTKTPKANKTITFTPKTKENYGLLNSQAKHERNEARKALHNQLKLNEQQLAKAEEKLSKPKKVNIKFQKADLTLEQLRKALNAFSEKAKNVDGYNFAFIDQKEGLINIVLSKEISDSNKKELESYTDVPVKFEVVKGGMHPVASMRGGSLLYNSSSATKDTSRLCMTAFGAKHPTYGTGMVTAAHCPSTMYILADDGRNYALQTSTVSRSQGTTNDEADLRFIKGSPIGVGQFYYNDTTSVRNVTGTRTRLSTNINKGTTPGTYVCHLGQLYAGSTSNIQSCGEVISLDTSFSVDANNNVTGFSSTGGSFVLMRNTQSGAGTTRTVGNGTLRCFPGDSGGPIFAGTIAFGVLSSCSWLDDDKNKPVTYAIYTSVDYFNKLGVSIIVP